MRSGVVLCVPSSISKPSQGLLYVSGQLQEKGVSLLQCTEALIAKEPDRLEEFIAQNNLQSVLVIADSSKESVMEALRYSIERAGLGRLSVCYLDIKLIDRQAQGAENKLGYSTILTNLARLERNDYVRDAIYRTAISPAKISRRQLLRSVPRALKVESDIPIVLQDKCTRRSNSCTYCIDACPVKAISATRESVVIDDRACLECGACARDCPIGAIQVPSISDDQIIAMLNTLSSEESGSNRRLLLLTCPIGFQKFVSEATENGNFGLGIVPVTIPCVAAIGSYHYLWAASLGVDLVTACPDDSCPRMPAVLRMQDHVESSKKVLENVGESRVAIQHLTLNRTDSMLDKVSPVSEQSGMKRGTELSGSRREATLEALKTLQAGKESALTVTSDHMLPFFDMTIDGAACTFCGVCEKGCPDHAISFMKDGPYLSLMFDPAACGGCKVCEKICPEGAIKITRHTELSDVMARLKKTKAKDEDAKCENCGASLGSKQGLLIIEKKLAKAGSSPAIAKSLHLCVRCKQMAFRPAK